MTQLATEINNNMNDEDNFVNPNFKMEETMQFFLKLIQHIYYPHIYHIVLVDQDLMLST